MDPATIEREFKAMRWRYRVLLIGLAGATFFFGLVAVLSLGAMIWILNEVRNSVRREVKAQTFSVSDQTGTEHAVLNVVRSGGVGLDIRDRGNTRASLVVAPGEPAMLVFWGQDQKPRVRLKVTAAGLPSLAFYDATGATRFLVGLTDEGQPKVLLFDEQGRVGNGLTIPDLAPTDESPPAGIDGGENGGLKEVPAAKGESGHAARSGIEDDPAGAPSGASAWSWHTRRFTGSVQVASRLTQGS
jgi:hypothetical protein